MDKKGIDRSEIVEMYKSGAAAIDIADTLDIHVRTVYYHLCKAGVDFEAQHEQSNRTERFVFRMTPDDNAAIKKLARHLRVKQSEAVRQAIYLAIRTIQD